jgi:hypothetical protein
MRDERQIRDWLMRLSAVGDDVRRARGIADEIQRRFRPGSLHMAATSCRMACAYAIHNPRPRHVEATRDAIRVLQDELEEFISQGA